MHKSTRVVLITGVVLALTGSAWAGQAYARYAARPYPKPMQSPIKVAPEKSGPTSVAEAFVNALLNGSFETNGGAGTNVLGSWTVVDQAGSDGSWLAQTGTLTPTSGNTVPAPPDGAFAAMSDQEAEGSHILYQDVTVPAGAVFKVDLFYLNSAADFSVPGPETLDYTVTPNQHFRIDIMSTSAPVDDVGAGVLRNIFITNPGDPLISGYRPIVADMSAFAGQTVRIRFAEVDNQSFFNVGVDNAVLGPAASQVPTLSWQAMAAMLLSLAAIGWLAARRFMA